MRIPNCVKQAGFTRAQWVDKLRAGLEWCGVCLQWIDHTDMSESNPSRCRECYRKGEASRYHLRKAKVRT